MPDKKPSSYKLSEPSYDKPVAYDRYFKTPILMKPLQRELLGKFTEFLDPEAKKTIEGYRGFSDAITLNSDLIPQSHKWDEEDLYSRVLKHELFHAFQSKKDKSFDPKFTLNPLNPKFYYDPSKSYFNILDRTLGGREAPAYLVNDEIKERTDLPQDSILQQALRQKILQRLIDEGYGREAKIWEKK